ncbi:MAG: response regulator transcription factor [Ruminococcaceae bacterium]|nr:response regulator transcription factor [Oscillospiraceae bacterium]
MKRILVVDDDTDISLLVADALEDEGFEVTVKNDSLQALEYIQENKSNISLILLDIMMPNLSGLDLCKKIRDEIMCPIILVSAKSKTMDKVIGLEMGADDYVAKPFVVEELVARVKAHLRRESRTDASDNKIIRIGEIELRTESFEVFKNGEPVPFSTREFQLLQYLMENAGKVLTREQIFSSVWDTEYGDIGTVAVNIKSIRDKIDKNNEYIKTVWGVGYKFVKVTGI